MRSGQSIHPERDPQTVPSRLDATYILPIRRDTLMDERELHELSRYLEAMASHVEVIVVDGSPRLIFEAHRRLWDGMVRHVATAPDLVTPNGKVGNVLTGVRLAQHERIIIADDDVRYSLTGLIRVLQLLRRVDIVRPQNYFDPLPWHARWDTARSLINRLTGGDWPGTLGVRRSALLTTGGYDGTVLFENLELVRTIRAAGGEESVPLDLFVRRRPPDARHFWTQRTRQAYDELARPFRMTVWLSVLPTVATCIVLKSWPLLGLMSGGAIALAELGRRRRGGARVFPWSASLLAPAWIMERAACSWLALIARLSLGGVPYRGTVLRRAATPYQALKDRFRRAHVDLTCKREGPLTSCYGEDLSHVAPASR